MPEPETFQIGQREPTDGASDVAQRITACVAVRRLIGSAPDPQPVQNDERRSLHTL
jgi:hypothetical protein